MRLSGIGASQLLSMPNIIRENIGMYGKMRATMTIALGMTMSILGIGNRALANMAGELGSAAK